LRPVQYRPLDRRRRSRDRTGEDAVECSRAMAPSTMRSSTTEMVERKVLEMAQHASFHQHVSYNLSTILHAFTEGKADPTEIAEAFSRARGIEVITRVVSGQPLAKPPVVSLCCQVGRQVLDKFGPGSSQSQTGRLVEAVVGRLALGISGDDAQAVECQVESARLMSSVAGQAAALLIDGGALGAVEGMLERLGGKHTSIFRPCCETLEQVSRTKEGRAAFEERGTGGVLLATIRDFPEALEEGSDAALASALKVVERIFTGKSPEACALSLRAKAEEESSDDPHIPTFSDYASCVETLLAVAEATPEAPGAAAATCLWWLSGASTRTLDRALSAILAAAAAVVAGGAGIGTDGTDGGGGKEEEEEEEEEEKQAAVRLSAEWMDVWSWFLRGNGGEDEDDEEKEEEAEEGGVVSPTPRPVEGARFLAALCLCKPGIQCLEGAVKRESPRRVGEALVTLCGSTDPSLAGACLRIIERLAKGNAGKQVFVDAGALVAAVEAGNRFEVEAGAETVGDAEARTIAASLGAVAILAEAGGRDARALVDEAFGLAVRCLGRVGEFSGRPAAAAAKSALDVITVRLTRSDRSHAAAAAAAAAAAPAAEADSSFSSTPAAENNGDGGGEVDESTASDDEDEGDEEGDVDAPMEALKDAGAILAVMKAHSADARVQQAGWRSLMAMDTGRGDVEKFWTGAGDRRQMLKDCLERHGGDTLVAGQVADILEGLVLHGDSEDEDGTSLTASVSDAHGEESPLLVSAEEPEGGGDDTDSNTPMTPGVGSERNGEGEGGLPQHDSGRLEGGDGADEQSPEGNATSALPQETQSLTRGGEDGGEGGEGGGVGTSEGDEGLTVAIVGEGTPKEVESGGGGDGDGDGPTGDAVGEGDGDLAPEDVLLELSLAGTRALEGGLSSSTATSSNDGGANSDADVGEVSEAGAGSPNSTRRPTVARSLFGDKKGVISSGRGGGQGGEEEGEEGQLDGSPAEVVLSKAELELQESWKKLETLHSDVLGRSHILGGEGAQMVAAMPEPCSLQERVGSLLGEYESGGGARDAFAAASLALVAALAAATGALATSQKEVQRYLDMSRDIRATSTWNDLSEAMQWTMASLKGTVILFTPQSHNGMTKAVGLCKNMDSASKLFKATALQVKIIVVELAGEHEPNTVWRVDPVVFESLPENRKVMMLRHLRSLVIAYDHLSDEMRRDLTTALEIIKNREVLNMMGKFCIQSEVAEERRREAKLASAEERLKVGTRRPSATRQGIPVVSGRRSPPIGTRDPSSSSRGSPNSSPPPPSEQHAVTPSRSSGAADAATPSSTGSNKSNSNNGNGKGNTSSGSRRVPLCTPRALRSTDSSSGNKNGTPGSGGGGGTGSSRTSRGVASHSRRRDTVARAAAAPPAKGGGRSKSPVAARRPGGRSKSPVPRSKKS
ncbi:unnamed protein product, partial [Pylaiella littoralis]